jgi:hypothetical protein
MPSHPAGITATSTRRGLLWSAAAAWGLPVFLIAGQALCLAAQTGDDPARDARRAEGIHLVTTGRLFEGIKLLDSLRLSGQDDREFLSQYAQCVFHACFPGKTQSAGIALLNATQLSDSVSPGGFTWKVEKSDLSPYPSYCYGAMFTLRKPFRLVFGALEHLKNPRAMLQLHTAMPHYDFSYELAQQLEDREDCAYCKIYIDFTDTRVSTFDYLKKRIAGIYDSVEIKDDLQRYEARSVRCYKRGFYRGEEGTYTAFIIFDRSLEQLFEGRARISPKDVGRVVRFAVTMQSGLEVKDVAEAKVQSILDEF